MDTTTPKPLPPGHTGLPLLGETLSFMKDAFGFIDQRVDEFGPVFRTRILGHDTACIAGPPASEKFIQEALCIRDGAAPKHVRELLGGRPLGVIDGVEHRSRKKQVLAGFSPEALVSYLPAMQHRVEAAFAEWAKAGEVRASNAFKRLALQVIADNVVGVQTGPAFESLLENFKQVTGGFMALPIPLPGTTYTKAIRARDRIMATMLGLVREHRAGRHDDGLARILRTTADDGATMTDADAAMELHHIYIAGYIIFAEFAAMIVELDRNRDVRDRLTAEVRGAAPNGPLTARQLGSMEYLNQFVKEVKRVTPVVPAAFGKAKKTFEVNGYRIPEGWNVFWSLKATNYYKDTFKDPKRFDPDRFSAERAEDKTHEHAFTPQGAGPDTGHKCPGTDYATLFMQVFATLLVRGFHWELPPQNLELKWGVIPPEHADGLRVVFRPQ